MDTPPWHRSASFARWKTHQHSEERARHSTASVDDDMSSEAFFLMENYFHIGAYARCVEAASECDDVDDVDALRRDVFVARSRVALGETQVRLERRLKRRDRKKCERCIRFARCARPRSCPLDVDEVTDNNLLFALDYYANRNLGDWGGCARFAQGCQVIGAIRVWR